MTNSDIRLFFKKLVSLLRQKKRSSWRTVAWQALFKAVFLVPKVVTNVSGILNEVSSSGTEVFIQDNYICQRLWKVRAKALIQWSWCQMLSFCNCCHGNYKLNVEMCHEIKASTVICAPALFVSFFNEDIVVKWAISPSSLQSGRAKKKKKRFTAKCWFGWASQICCLIFCCCMFVRTLCIL